MNKEFYNELKRLPLFDICINRLGYCIHEKKDCTSWRCLKDTDGTTLLVRGWPDQRGHYFAYDLEEGRKKDLTDILIQKGYTFKRIREEFGNYQNEYTTSRFWKNNQDKKDNTATVLHILKNHKDGNTVPYVDNVLARRGLSSDTLKFFGLPLYKKTAMFALYYYQEETKKFGIQTAILYTFWQGETKKLFLKGLRRGSSFSLLRRGNNLKPKGKKALFFESPVDALSYFQLYKEGDALYFSTCGRPTFQFKKSIKTILKLLGVEEVKICTDNDEAGKNIAAELRHILKSSQFKYSEHRPREKDWNSELKEKASKCSPRLH